MGMTEDIMIGIVMLMEDLHRKAEENEEDMMNPHIITCTRMITKMQST